MTPMGARKAAWLVASCAVFVALYATVAMISGVHLSDAGEFTPMARAMRELRFSDVYPPGQRGSTPLYPLLVLLPEGLFGRRLWLYATAAPIGGLIVTWSCWSLGLRNWWRLTAVAVVFSVAPSVLEATVRYGHPHDILAGALLVAGAVQIPKERWVACALLLAAALIMRHVVVIGIIPLLAAVPRERWPKVGGVFVATVVVVSAPFALPQRRAFYDVLAGTTTRHNAF
jgi:hypothetical protein